MKIARTLFIAILLIAMAPMASAQTADEIIDTYFENTGGKANWEKIKSIKSTGKASFGPQEFPFTQYMMEDGRMAVTISLQGQELTPQAFDGENMWGTNFQSMQAEAQDSETSENYKKNEAKDMPDVFLNYKDKGYTVEKMDDDTIEGTEVFKIKLTKNPIMVDGKEEESVSIYYFDKENFVPIASETTINAGPQKGMTTQTVFSEYLEAGDVYMPFNITQKFNGQVGQSITIENIEINPDIDESIFEMPEKN